MKKRIKKGFSKKQVVIITVLFAIAIVINLITFLVIKNPSHTGFGTESTASVIFEILPGPEINITHPYDNYTYNFSEIAFGPYGPFTLDLNVTSNQPEHIISWKYTLYDVKHNLWHSAVVFNPNITFDAVRWENRLFVEAETDYEKTAKDNITFYVWYYNTAPILGPINDTIYVCENSFLNYGYYADDADEDFLEGWIIPQDIPQNLFFVFRTGTNSWGNITYFVIASGPLNKGNLGGVNKSFKIYEKTVGVKDREYSDYKNTNITLLEINNPPRIGEITTKTVWTRGENSTLFEILDIHDVEYDLGFGNLSFNDTIRNRSSGKIVDLFNITYNSTDYYINFSAINKTVGIYDVLICFNDTGLTNPHPELMRVCGQNGGSQTTCEYFELTITNENRPPTIVDYYPDNNKSINVSGGDKVYFNITKYDPDGSTPATFWLVDGKLIEYDEGNITDEFYLEFGCGVSGKHIVKAEITDGELNDSVNWSFNVAYVPCVSPPPGGGGGGGGGVPSCTPLWGCGTWGLCQHAKTSLDIGLLAGTDYRKIEQECLSKDLDEGNCGFQIRGCADLKNCSLKYGKPEEIQWCHYTEKPSCYDKIKNCHDGECELLVDCGGPCKQCPTCTDKIKNQGEEGIDCGGPCPWKCVPEIPLIKKKSFWYMLLIIALILITIIIIRLVRVLRYKKGIAAEKKEKV